MDICVSPVHRLRKGAAGPLPFLGSRAAERQDVWRLTALRAYRHIYIAAAWWQRW